MIRRLGTFFTALSLRFMPHPFVFAILLTLIAFLLAVVWNRSGPQLALSAWFDGFSNASLLTFAFQMALVLVTGHALAGTPPVQRLLEALCRPARGTRSAAVIVSLTAMIAALLNWGLGLVVGAMLAREMGRSAIRRGVPLHYPLVVAAGYTGLLIWHGGLSGSAPLSVATAGHPLEARMGILPVTQTLLSPLNLAVTIFLLVAVPIGLALMAPRGIDRVEGPVPDRAVESPVDPGPRTPARRLEDSRVLAWSLAAGGAFVLGLLFARQGGGAIHLNSLNLAFLVAGLALHGTPMRYARAVDDAAKTAGGILLQFPFYFGVMGLMQGTGLVERFAQASVSASRSLANLGVPVESAHAVLTFLSASVVNLFVPSGGGQWAVQGPVAVEAAAALGTAFSTTVLALAYGDELTNMLQPFWALPLLAVTGLAARQIVGYTALIMLLVTPGFLVFLILFGR